MGLKVIGAGFGRTGTRSLKTALEQLGFSKCYHMEEVIKHPRHLKHWGEIMNGGAKEWGTLFEGYQSATDWPVAAYYRELMILYPDAKIILTVRDPERWHRSIMHTIYQISRGFRRYARIVPAAHRFLSGMERVVWQGVFHNRLEDKAHAMEVFKKHIQEVKRTVPEDRLLVFEARQGWEPLCAFLNVPVPTNQPFPHKNKGKFIRWVLNHRSILQRAALIVVIMVLLFLARVLFF